MCRFGDRLREIRQREEMSQSELARILYISPQTITAWETGRVVPRLDMAVTVAEFFGVSLDWLTGRATTPQIKDKYGRG